jgi:iron(III) transport system substrate-binding protein
MTHHHDWKKYLVAAFSILGGVGVMPFDAPAQSSPLEGSVVFYSAAPASVLDELTKAFTAKYPNVRAEYYRGNSAQVFQRVMSESSARRVQADVVHVSDPATMDEIRKAGNLESYASPEFKHYDPRYVAEDRTWFIARGHFLNIAYNPRLVPEDRAPKSWRDLVDPRFKGKVGIMDVRNAGGAYYWQFAAWKLYGPDHFVEMYNNRPKLYPGHGPINDRVITGELLVGADLNYLTDEAILEKKAPIKAVFPDEGAPLILSPAGIVKNAPHPKAARVFIDFLASAEGQAIFNSVYSYSMRGSVPVRQGMTPLADIKAMELSTEEMLARQAEIQAAARKAFGYQ